MKMYFYFVFKLYQTGNMILLHEYTTYRAP